MLVCPGNSDSMSLSHQEKNRLEDDGGCAMRTAATLEDCPYSWMSQDWHLGLEVTGLEMRHL